VARLRRAQAEQTRDQIVATARRLFAEKGYFATGTAEIVLAAGVGTRGALYHHFPSKEVLFAAVLEAVEAALTAEIAATLAGATRRDRLREALHGGIDASLHPDVRQIVLIDGPAVLGWTRWRESASRYGLRALRDLLEAGREDGSLVCPDPSAMAHLLLSLVGEAALLVAHAADPEAARAAAGRSIDALLGGLAPRPG
jgi:AcrR family transcriptional regulator